MKIENNSNKDTSGVNKSQNEVSNSSGKNLNSQSSNDSEKDTNSNIGNRRHYVGGEHRSSQGHVFHDDASDTTTK